MGKKPNDKSSAKSELNAKSKSTSNFSKLKFGENPNIFKSVFSTLLSGLLYRK